MHIIQTAVFTALCKCTATTTAANVVGKMAAYPSGMTHRVSGDNERNRALLFGAQYRDTGVVRPAGSVVATNEREMMEASNSHMVDGLMGRVGQMRDVSLYHTSKTATSCLVANGKEIAIDIGEEVKSQNEFLHGMSGNFDHITESLTETMRKLRRLSESASGGHMIVLAAFALVFFLLVWFLFPR